MTSPALDAGSSAGEPTLAEAFAGFGDAVIAGEESGESKTSTTSEAAPAPAAKESTALVPTDKESKTLAPTSNAGELATTDATNIAEGENPDDEKALLEGSKPLTYTVDGASKTFDGIHEYEGGGAVIMAAALPRVKDKLQQADRLYTQNQQLYERNQAYEQLGGVKGYEALTAKAAVLDVSGTVLLRALSDENTLIQLATDPAARESLIREVKLAAREAHLNASSEFQRTTAKFAEQRQSVGQSQTVIGNAVAQLARSFEGLTAEDVETVKNHALRVQSAIVRSANADEARAAGVKVGDQIVDLPVLHQFLADRHAMRRAQAVNAKRDAEAARDNKAALAAAAPAAGKPTNTPRPGVGKPAPKPAANKTLDEMSSAELTRAFKSGRIFDLIGNAEE